MTRQAHGASRRARREMAQVMRMAGVPLAGALAIVLAACSSPGGTTGGGTGGGGGGATAAAAPAHSASAAAADGGVTGSDAVPDPCQVVTSGDASQLTGTAMSPAKDKKLSRGARLCEYKGTAGGKPIIVLVTVARFSHVSAGVAQAYYQQAVSKFSGIPGVHLAHPGIGDKSLAGTVSFGAIAESAIAFLKGNVYVSVLTMSHTSIGALKAVATAAAGRV